MQHVWLRGSDPTGGTGDGGYLLAIGDRDSQRPFRPTLHAQDRAYDERSTVDSCGADDSHPFNTLREGGLTSQNSTTIPMPKVE
jgi:hypothetical protein